MTDAKPLRTSVSVVKKAQLEVEEMPQATSGQVLAIAATLGMATAQEKIQNVTPWRAATERKTT